MKLKVKRTHSDAVLPLKTKGNAGYDLTAMSCELAQNYIEYDTGIAVEIPDGYVGLLFPRSSVSKTDLAMANSVGVVDSSYRGSVRARFRWLGSDIFSGKIYKVGERCCQLVIVPIMEPEIEEVVELSDTSRGGGGFGSTGA